MNILNNIKLSKVFKHFKIVKLNEKKIEGINLLETFGLFKYDWALFHFLYINTFNYTVLDNIIVQMKDNIYFDF